MPTVDSFLKKQDSVISRGKQGSIRSTRSNKSDETAPTTPPPSFNDEDMIKSETDNLDSVPDEKFPTRAGSVRSTRSNFSTMSDKGEHGLGRILLTMSYSMSRQRFEVTVHRIT